MLGGYNNDPNNNMDDKNLGQSPPYRSLSPQPGCSRHFYSVDEVNTIADNILKAINRVLGSINHASVVTAIQSNLRSGNNHLSLQDLLPSNLQINRKRRNSEHISAVETKKSKGDVLSSFPSGFWAGNPVNIKSFSTAPLCPTPQKSRDINKAVSDPSTSIEIVAKPQIATPDSSADKRTTSVSNVGIGIDRYKKELQLVTERLDIVANAALNWRMENIGSQIKVPSTSQLNRPAVIPLTPGPGWHDGQLNVGGPIQVDNLPASNQAQSSVGRQSIGNNVCEEIYHKLRAMFPNIDRYYLKTFCPADWAPGLSRDVQFGSIVERILKREGYWVMDVNPTNDQAERDHMTPLNVDDTYEHLMAIFPNADPQYLRSAAENLKNDNDIKAFVDENLNSNNYPTREQYLAKIRVTEEQQRYTTNFNVEQFLSLFPDPFKYFEDGKRKTVHNWVVLEFLKDQFRKVRVNTISRTYQSCRYNMSLAAKDLRLSTDFIMNARRGTAVPTENISLLQEMAFVRHHEEIRKHMETAKQREEEEFNSLKAAGNLRTCQCCYDEECMPSKCSTCENSHVFCNSCVVNGTDSKLGDGETHVPCFLSCGSEFSISTLQRVLPPTKFSILLKKRQAAEVMAAGLEGLVSCPFCHFASIPPEGDKVFKCLNPECMKESCIQCKEPNHVPYACGELSKSDEARKYIEEKMTQALTRICYKCKKSFFKEEGCNKMICPCGALMCYICSQPVKNYTHFRGQGSNEVDKCPLWSDNIRLNAEIVRKVGEDARKKILSQNPSLNIDTARLAPALPPRTAGPHSDIDISATENLANVLAARVLNKDPPN